MDDRKKILRYTFQGKVIENGRSAPPPEFDETLKAFIEKFESDIENMASPEFIEKTFGPQYKDLKGYTLIGWNRYNEVFGNKGDENSYLYDLIAEQQLEGKELNAAKKKEKEDKQRAKTFFNNNANLFINANMRNTERVLDKYYGKHPPLGIKDDEESIT